jgi:asparagine synthase (glutamine-hydrolysing)
MCGITGIVDRAVSSEELGQRVRRMNSTLRHRGPDGSDTWLDAEHGVGFGHTRLAIIDLTADGRQPMRSHSGRFVITYNGEVYNFKALRAQLGQLGRIFRGHSDTEVVLEAIEQWGLRSSIERFVGMFAFALWDRQLRTLTLVRDRIGKKPLYYCINGGRVLFASELKALQAVPGFATTLDAQALGEYFKYHYIPAPLTIYRGTRKLLPGSLVTIDCAQAAPVASAPIRYWSPAAVFAAAREQPFRGTEDEALEQLEPLLQDAVRLRMVADVPLGAFLSGGVDSSAIVAHMQSVSSRPVRTFTIGTKEGTYDEAEHAAAVAKHLGTEHSELYVESRDALEIIPRLPIIYDEPFADSSQIPTFLVSRLARQHVTVGLSGDGGDEVFVGYNRYLLADRLRRFVARLPPGMVRVANGFTRRVSPASWLSLLEGLRWLLPGRLRDSKADDRLTTLARMLGAKWPWGIYEALTCHWDEDSFIVLSTQEQAVRSDDSPHSAGERATWSSLAAEMAVADQSSYLPDDILVKVDRASMAASLEARAPFLDHRLIEFTARLPTSMNLVGGIGKRLLRRSLYRYVPRELVERPKTGFGVPIDYWLRNELRDWAEELLSERRLKAEGVINARPIREAWRRHLVGNRQEHHRLWSVLMFQSWLEQSRARPASAATLASCA